MDTSDEEEDDDDDINTGSRRKRQKTTGTAPSTYRVARYTLSYGNRH